MDLVPFSNWMPESKMIPEPPYSLDQYEFFWSGPFSQWYPFDMVIDDILFNCAEQYMMYMKATLFGDSEVAKSILQTKLPREQKHLGRTVKNFNPSAWERYARSIVFVGNYIKFTTVNQYPNMEGRTSMKDVILSTGEKIFVEASPLDKVWGIGKGENDIGIEDPSNWKGTNWLGECLTEARYWIKYDDEVGRPHKKR